MNMPGFTAGESLYKTRRQYSMNNAKLLYAEANILPQLIKGTGKKSGNPALNRICQDMADVINAAFEESYQQTLGMNFAEGAAWNNLGYELLEAAGGSKACSFSGTIF